MKIWNIVLASLFLSGSVIAQDFTGEEMKLKMQLPSGFDYSIDMIGNWAMMESADNKGDVIFNVYAHVGEIKKKEVVEYAADRTKIPKKIWRPIEERLSQDGFEFWELFTLKVGEKNRYAAIAKNKSCDITYLFIIAVDNTKPVKDEEYIKMLESIVTAD